MPSRVQNALVWAAGAVLLVLHIALVLRVYPPALLLRGDIPLAGDVPRYFATSVGAAATGGLYGYDPYAMAGYPVGLWNSMGKKGFEIAHLIFPGIGLPRLFYDVLAGLAIFGPLAMWAALRGLFPTAGGRRTLFVLTLVFWHLGTDIAYFWTFGNIFFPVTSCAIVMMVVLLDRVLAGRYPWPAALGLGLIAAAVFYAHTVALVAAIVPLLFLLAWRLRGGRIAANRWLALLLAVALCAGLCLPWLVPLLQTRGDSVSMPKEWFQGGLKYTIMDMFSDRAYRRHFDRNFLLHVSVVAGIAGNVWLWRRRSSPTLMAIGAGGLTALAIAYLGPLLGFLGPIQPYRFTIPATMLLLVPAAVAIDAGATALRHASAALRATVAALLLVMLPDFTAYLIDAARPRDDLTLAAENRAVLDRLAARNIHGRVLTDDATLGHLIPHFTRLPVLGGLSTQAFLKHRFAGIDEDGIGFGRHARDWSPDALKPYLDAYGVGYAVLATPAWRALAARSVPTFQLEEDLGGRGLYRIVGNDAGLVLTGAADVTADYAGIAVSNIRESPLVLKFHYAPWLTAGPGVRLEPVTVLDDPVPFIRAVVDPGVTAFVIRKGR